MADPKNPFAFDPAALADILAGLGRLPGISAPKPDTDGPALAALQAHNLAAFEAMTRAGAVTYQTAFREQVERLAEMLDKAPEGDNAALAEVVSALQRLGQVDQSTGPAGMEALLAQYFAALGVGPVTPKNKDQDR